MRHYVKWKSWQMYCPALWKKNELVESIEQISNGGELWQVQNLQKKDQRGQLQQFGLSKRKGKKG
jgi:hypothetical protein